jgi:transcriptional regulator with XRE-family HTH domain
MGRQPLERKNPIGQALTAHRLARTLRDGRPVFKTADEPDLTQEQVAELLNEASGKTTHTNRTYGKWERDGSIGKENRNLLASVYGITVSELFKPPSRTRIERIVKLLEGRPDSLLQSVEVITERLIEAEDRGREN